jgi:TldD protein
MVSFVQALLPELCAWLDRQGADYAEVRYSRQETLRLRARGRELEQAIAAESAGLGIRVLYRGAFGFACVAEGDGNPAERADACARDALAAARAAASVSPDRVRLCEAELARGHFQTPVAIDPFALAPARLVEDLLRPVELMLGDPQQRIRSAQAHLLFRREHKRVCTSDGSDVTQVLSHGAAGMSCVAEWRGDVQQRSYPMDHDGGCAAGGYELVAALDLAGAAERVREEAIALTAAEVAPSGPTTVILGGEQLALQIHESCGHPSEADRALGEEASLAGGSFLSPDRLGRYRYGSPIVNLTADARAPGGVGSFGWDDEATPARAIPLVARGQFVGYLSSRATASRLGLAASGGAMRAESFARPPIIRMTNVSLDSPADGPTLAELIADTRKGLLLGCNKSWSIDDVRWNFQFACQAAWQIQDGKLGALYKNPSYTGVTPAFWTGCDAICGPGERKLWGFLNCGKGDPMQLMWVGHACAPARFRNVSVWGAG